MMSILFKQPERADDRDNPVRVGFGGAPCPVEIFEPFEERFGVALTEIYGSTETSLVCDMPPARRRIGTCGTETELYQLRIVDAEDNEVPAGTPGEIVARPKNPGWMFDGYHANAAATAEAWRNLWFHTGDRGQVDPRRLPDLPGPDEGHHPPPRGRTSPPGRSSESSPNIPRWARSGGRTGGCARNCPRRT